MAIILGKDCKLLGGTASGSTITLPSTEWKNVTDVTVGPESDTAEVTTRANNGYKAFVPTLKDFKIEFTIYKDSTDTCYTTLQSAYLANTEVCAYEHDGNGEGFAGNFYVTSFSENQALGEAVSISVNLVHGSGTIVKVSGGTIVTD